ncbi:MAG: DUF1559 domain-containing protein [Zavarzinella sp.]
MKKISFFSSAYLLIVAWCGHAATIPPEVAKFIDANTVLVGRIQPASLDMQPIIDLVIETDKTVSNEAKDVSKSWKEMQAAFTKAGGKDVWLLYRTTDFPNNPVILITGNGTPFDTKMLERLSEGANPFRDWAQKIDIHNGVALIGNPTALDATKSIKSAARSDLTSAFEALPEGQVSVVVSLPQVARDIIQDSVPEIPTEIGGGKIELFTKNLQSIGLSLNVGKRSTATCQIQCEDNKGAMEMLKWLSDLEVSKLVGAGDEPMRAWLAKYIQLFVTKTKVEVKDARISAIISFDAAIPLVVDFLKTQPATRTVSANNMKQIGLAIHNYADTHGHFPCDICDENGKPLLSWRVAILPYIEQEVLYRQFRLNEPWDSEHNIRLSEVVVKVFSPKSLGRDQIRQTNYLMPTGKGLAGEIIKEEILDKNRKPTGKFKYRGQKFTDFHDGTSNTVILVEADPKKAVIWTKPGDLVIDPANPVQHLQKPYDTGFLSLLGDGSVHFFLSKCTIRKKFYPYFTRSGGEIPTLEDE